MSFNNEGYTYGSGHSGFQSDTGSFKGYVDVPHVGLQYQNGGQLSPNGPFGGSNQSDSMWGPPLYQQPEPPPSSWYSTQNQDKPFGSW